MAETWFDASKYFLGDMFDITMNCIFRNTVQDCAADGKAGVLHRQSELMREAHPPQAYDALMNLLSSHDQARALQVFGWHDDTRDAAVIALAKQRLRLAVLFQMIFLGSPSVYDGDEVGVTGGDDPYNRATYPWADPDAPLFVDDQMVVLARRPGNTSALTATNNAATPQTVTLALRDLPAGFPLDDLRDDLRDVLGDVQGGWADLGQCARAALRGARALWAGAGQRSVVQRARARPGGRDRPEGGVLVAPMLP